MMHMNLDLLVLVMWKLSMPQAFLWASGCVLCISFQRMAPEALTQFGKWNLKGGGDGRLINLSSFCRLRSFQLEWIIYVLKLSICVSTQLFISQDRKKRKNKSDISSSGQVSRTSEKNWWKNQHATPVFNSYTSLTAYIRFCLSHRTQFPFLQSPQPSCPTQKFYTIVAALSVHPVLTWPPSTTVMFPVNFFP